MRRKILIVSTVVLLLAAAWIRVFAAADYTFVAPVWQVITVPAGSVKNVQITSDDITLVQLGIQDDGSTASVSTDQVIVMRNQDASGAAVAMAANLNDGVKAVLLVRSALTFPGRLVPNGADGGPEIQLQGVGHGSKVMLIHGRSPRE